MRKIPFILAGLVSLILVACSSPSKTLVAQLGVMIAVERVVKDDPAKAAKAIQIADEVIKLAGKDSATTVEAVIALVRSKIDWQKLAAESPTSVTAVNLLLAAIEVELKDRVSKGLLPDQYVFYVKTVAEWVKLAAEPFAPHA